MLLNSFITEMNLQAYRLCWINGRFGSGKTSVAYMLVKNYLDKGYRLITNNRCVWADDMADVKPLPDGKLKCIVILDEGGLEFKANRQIEMVAAYAAKMDVMYIIPSYFPPARAAQVLTVQAVFNFKSAAIPLVVYKWRIRIGGNFDDKGFFLWWRPNEIYGIYSRSDPGAKSRKIVSWIVEQTEAYRKHWGYEGEDELLNMEGEGGQVDLFADSVEGLADAVGAMQALPKRGRRR